MSRQAWKLLRCVLLSLLAWAGTGHGSARAQSADQLARAKTHFEAGRALYNLGNYTDAVREFLAGYELAPRREFLLNIAQTYRKLRDFPRARAMYDKYLAEAPADDPRREAVRKSLAEVDQLSNEAKASPGTKPGVDVTTRAMPGSVTDSTGSESTATSATGALADHASEPPKKSFIKRHWWIIPVAVVVVGVGLGVGLGLGLKSDPCAGNTIGCLDATAQKLQLFGP